MADLKDILNESDHHPGDKELMNYVHDNLSEQEKNELEKNTVDSKFVNDALEGLQTLADKQQMNTYVQQLNKNLQKQLAGKRERKNKRHIPQNIWIVIAILAMLCICVVGYLFIHYFRLPS